MHRFRRIVSRPAVALAMALTLTAAVADAQTKINPGWNLFSPEQDVEVGQQSAQAAQQQLPLLNDAQINSYVNRIGQRLAANAGGPNFQYQFRVVNSSDINAFALPGGFIYVNRGVLEQAKNEGEVAGVLAHEVAHVALRHGTHQASKAYAAQAGISILGGLLGGRVGQGTADIINAVGGIGLNALFLKYSRDLETQADIRGSQILAASGYSPVDMVNFFHTLESVDKSKKTSWTSDHPAPPDRIARIQKESQMLHVAGSPVTNVAELNTIKSRLRGTGAAPTAQQIAQGTAAQTSRQRSTNRGTGATGAAVRVDPPSSSMRSYTSRSGVYRISYPANWQVIDQSATGVTLGPSGGVGTINGQTEVVYGAIVNHYDPFGSQPGSSLRGTSGSNVYGGNVSLDDATNDLLGQIQQSSPHLRLITNSGQRVRMGGGSAIAASLQGTNPNTGIAERLTVVTRQLGDGHLIYMLFVTPQAEANNYSNVLSAMVNSMQINDEKAH